MRDDYLRMCLQPRLNPPALPVPEYDVALPIATADPLPVRRKPDLAGIAGDGVSSKPFLPVLPEVVRTVNEDLIVERLGGKVFF